VTTRVYLPSTLGRLGSFVADGGIGPAPLAAHAVTEEVRRGLADAGEEEWEYAASSAASLASVGLLDRDEPARRVVIAVDVPKEPQVGDPEDPTAVRVDEVVPLRRVAAVLADAPDAEGTVAAAREALAGDSDDADRLLERCLDHELGWWATQEIGDLLGTARP